MGCRVGHAPGWCAERPEAQEGNVEAGEVTEYDGITYATIRVRRSDRPSCNSTHRCEQRRSVLYSSGAALCL